MSTCKRGHVDPERDASGHCKECERERARKRYATNPERKREQARKWRATNLERAREQVRKWRAANPERKREQDRKWRAANLERERELSRKHQGLPAPTRPEPHECECCERPAWDRALHLDHDHRTGAFRGWLCTSCNTAIGKLGDDRAGLLRALAYLYRAEVAA